MDIKSELKKEINLYRSETVKLKEKLNEIAEKKLGLQKNKSGYTSKINSLIAKIRSHVSEQKKLVEEIKKAVSNKEALYKELNSKTSSLKELNDKITDLNKKFEQKLSSAQIKRIIESLEYKIQTEVISFEKEKQINKQIKKLKSDLIYAKELEELFRKKSALINEIHQLKSNIKSLSESITSNKKNLNTIKENNDTLSMEIAKLKDQRGIINKELDFINSLFFEIDAQLKGKLLQLSSLSAKLQEMLSIEQNKKREFEEKITKEKQELVLEKIKRGEKLTNEDLIMFQWPQK